MPGNYTPMYGAIPVEKQQKNFAQESKMIKEIAETIRANKNAAISANNPLVNALFNFIYKHGSLKIPEGDKAFWVDEKCNSCGVCEKTCPVRNIKMTDGKPVWLHHCEQCVACRQWCPQEAIQVGKKTAARKRYHQPDIQVQDIMNQQKN